MVFGGFWMYVGMVFGWFFDGFGRILDERMMDL